MKDLRKKRSLASLMFAGVLVLGILTIAAPSAFAGETNDGVCSGLDSGKIDVQDPPSVLLTAPPGMLIDEYCVKAGSQHNGFGPVYVPVDPPVASLTITYPGKDSISHYSFGWTDAPEEECPEGTTGEFPDCESPEEPPEEECPEGTTGTPPDCDEVGGEVIDKDPTEEEPDEVLPNRFNRGKKTPAVKGQVLPFTGQETTTFLMVAGLMMAAGLSLLLTSRVKARSKR